MQLIHFLPLAFFRWCENEFIGNWIKESTWVFAIVETIHIMALAMLLGTIFIVDIRLLGFGMRRQSPAQLAKDLAPWTLTGIALMILTGIPLFLSEATRLSSSGPFCFKMVFLVLALLIHFTIYRRATQPGSRQHEGINRLAGCLSLICWFGVALAGRAIAFL